MYKDIIERIFENLRISNQERMIRKWELYNHSIENYKHMNYLIPEDLKIPPIVSIYETNEEFYNTEALLKTQQGMKLYLNSLYGRMVSNDNSNPQRN